MTDRKSAIATLRALESANAELAGALEALLNLQNGPPLIREAERRERGGGMSKRKCDRPFGLKPKEVEALIEALHQWTCLEASLCSGRQHRRSTMKRLAELNYVVEHSAVRVDGDGWTIQPERYAVAWMLTVAGLDVAQRLLKMQNEEMDARIAARERKEEE